MRSFETVNDLNDNFWRQYSGLWNNSIDKSPFQAPELLKYFAGHQPIRSIAFQLLADQEPSISVIFKKAGKNYSFLSDFKSDANWFVFHEKANSGDIEFFFLKLLEKIKQEKCNLILNTIPSHACFMNQLEIAGKNSGLFWRRIKYAVCHSVVADTSGELLKMINSSGQTRSSVNKIKKQKNPVFEVFTNDLYLEQWVSDFCEAHIRRWANTKTPSVFTDKNKQDFLLNCLKAWDKENLLVRFSISIDQKRISFVIGLREGNTLIHHSTTFDPDFRKLSPGRSLIQFIAEWMVTQNLNILDFGNGDEGYKSFFSNTILDLDRIFIASRYNLMFILKVSAIKHIRNNNEIYQFYKQKIKIHLK